MSTGMKRTIDELFIDAAPAAAPPAQAALAAHAALAASPPPPLRALMKDPVAVSPGSETEEEDLVDGMYTICGIRSTPPRLLFTPTPPDSKSENCPMPKAMATGGSSDIAARVPSVVCSVAALTTKKAPKNRMVPPMEPLRAEEAKGDMA